MLFKHLLIMVACLTANQLQALIIMQIFQSGDDVIATASGTANTTGLTQSSDASITPAVRGSNLLRFGVGGAVDFYTGISTTSFGSSDFYYADSGTGDNFGFYSNNLFLPDGYVSGSSLSGTATWNNTTLAGLGLIEGSYNITWGSDSISLSVSSAVPEPETYALFMGGSILVFLLGYRKIKRTQKA